MFNSLLTRIFGSSNERQLRQLQRIVAKINALEPETQALSDDQLKARTDEFKQRIAGGESLDKVLPRPSRYAARPVAACSACATTTCS